ncbi:MAG: hypothetical protein ACYC6N_26300 [Pirellulaceae bacterium]
MTFEDRLHKAIERGKRRSAAARSEAESQALSEDELRRLYATFRLQLSEHIEKCIRQLPNYFPGFRYETLYGERGWGAACNRDDLRMAGDGRRENDFSRLEMTVRPASSLHVLNLAAKGTIRNKEVFNRNYFEKLQDVDLEKFMQLVDVWVVEYAELYAAKSS